MYVTISIRIYHRENCGCESVDDGASAAAEKKVNGDYFQSNADNDEWMTSNLYRRERAQRERERDSQRMWKRARRWPHAASVVTSTASKYGAEINNSSGNVSGPIP